MRQVASVAAFAALLAAGCASTATSPSTTTPDAPTPVYLTFVGHIEDGEMLTRCPAWSDHREQLLAWAVAIAPYTDTFNLQIDLPFVTGMVDCETDAERSTTGGENILQYLVDHHGFEIDPHQEGAWEDESDSPDNYADVHKGLSGVVDQVTDTVGGVVWNDPDQLARLGAGDTGRLFPNHRWEPDLLTMAVHRRHHRGDFSRDDDTSGVWHPAAATAEGFLRHDAEQPLPYIGSGLQHSNWSGGQNCDFESTVHYAAALAAMIADGDAPSGRMYTATLAIPSSVMFDATRHEQVLEWMAEAADLAASGTVVIASYREVLDIWEDEYDRAPNIFEYADMDPTRYTCPHQ